MHREGGVHTVCDERGGWSNTLDGRVLSRHRAKDDAIETGRAIARQLEAQHTVHGPDGGIVEVRRPMLDGDNNAAP